MYVCMYTLYSGTYLYSPYMAMPPPPRGNKGFETVFRFIVLKKLIPQENKAPAFH